MTKRIDTMKRDMQLLDEHLQKEAWRRHTYVTEILKREPSAITKAAIEPLISEVAAMLGEEVRGDESTSAAGASARPLAPSSSTVCRWIFYSVRSGNDVRVLVSATHRRGNRTPRLRPEVAEAIERHVLDSYMTPNRYSAKDIYALVVNELKIANSRREAPQPLDQKHLQRD
jgi:putative transposase